MKNLMFFILLIFVSCQNINTKYQLKNSVIIFNQSYDKNMVEEDIKNRQKFYRPIIKQSIFVTNKLSFNDFLVDQLSINYLKTNRANENIIKKYKTLLVHSWKKDLMEKFIISKIKINEDDIKRYYDKSSFRFEGLKSYKESRDDIIKILKHQKFLNIYNMEIINKLSTITVENIHYKDLKVDILEFNGLKISEYIIMNAAYSLSKNKKMSYDDAYRKVIDVMDKKTQFLKKLSNIGIYPNNSLEFSNILSDLENQFIDKIKNRVKVSDNDLKNFYNNNKNLYISNDNYSFYLIIYDKNKFLFNNNKIIDLANDVLEKLKKSPSKFPYYAKKYGANIERHKNGYLGWVSRSTFKKESGKIIDNGEKTGLINRIVKEDDGYYIIFIHKRKREMAELSYIYFPKASDYAHKLMLDRSNNDLSLLSKGKTSLKSVSNSYNKLDKYYYKQWEFDNIYRMSDNLHLSKTIINSNPGRLYGYDKNGVVALYKLINHKPKKLIRYNQIKDLINKDYIIIHSLKKYRELTNEN